VFKFEEWYNGLVWNFFAAFFYAACMEVVISVSLNIDMLFSNTDIKRPFIWYCGAVFTALFATFQIIFMCLFIPSLFCPNNKTVVRNMSKNKKYYGAIYEELRYKKWVNRLFPVLFMGKRIYMVLAFFHLKSMLLLQFCII
jgi:hypothetical protein